MESLLLNVEVVELNELCNCRFGESRGRPERRCRGRGGWYSQSSLIRPQRAQVGLFSSHRTRRSLQFWHPVLDLGPERPSPCVGGPLVIWVIVILESVELGAVQIGERGHETRR